MAKVSEPIRAAGVVVFHPDDSTDPRFLAVHRPSRADWSLPKGKVDSGETVPCAAVRECDEETGYRVSLSTRLPTLRYKADGQDKIVDYWIGQVRGDEGFAPDEEVDEIRWVPATDAERFLTYRDDAGLVRKATTVPATTPLMILRHAKAMKRADFDGPDDAERPLSGRGRSEAKQLTEVLDAYGIEQVHSSPFKRCVSTVNRYARSIGVEVQLDSALSEFGHSSDPSATEQCVRDLLQEPVPMVICTHRPVLPSVVSALAGALDLAPSSIVEDPNWDTRLAPGGMLVIHREWTAQGPRAYAVEQHQLPRS
jgi:8-oxo-dGTP pyrophosphatase MutT (NUDIX family)/phosphohistidine phosphatase SixA